MGQSHQPGIDRLPFIGGQHPAGGACGNRGGQGRGPVCKQHGRRLDIHVPAHATIDVILVVGAVHPGDHAAHERTAVGGILRIPEFLDEHWAVGEGGVNVRLPKGVAITTTLVVVDVRRIDDSVTARDIRHRTHTLVIPRIALASDDADILRVGATGVSSTPALGCSNGIHDRLKARGGETFGGRAPVQPDSPGSRIGLVEGVEENGWVIGVTGGHAGPEDQAVLVGHGILFGGRTRGPASGPLKVDVAVDVVGIAVGHEGIYEALVGRLAGGTPVVGSGLGVTVPPVLVQGNADAIDVPIFHRFLQLRHHPVAAGGTVPRLGFPFQRIQVHPGQPHGASPASSHDLVTRNLQERRRRFQRRDENKKSVKEKTEGRKNLPIR